MLVDGADPHIKDTAFHSVGLQGCDFLLALQDSLVQEAEVNEVTVGATGLQQPLDLKKLQAAAEVADLLQDLGAGGAGAKMAMTTCNFHGCLLSIITQIYLSVKKKIHYYSPCAKACPVLISVVRSDSTRLRKFRPCRTA
jgi:hypothetical protein